MAAEVYNSNFNQTVNQQVNSYLCLVIYQLETLMDCKMGQNKQVRSQILTLTPEEMNIDTIWEKLNIDESKLISKAITGIQVIDKNVTITTTGTVEDYENYNVHVDDGNINVDNNVQTTVTNTVDTNVTNQPTVRLNEPIDVTVTNMP